ncbi:MAG: hypothetical protein R6W90_07595 [Ignavibacteriaceae bacterium]
MNIYETIDLIRIKLEEGKHNQSDLLFGYNIVIDPYSDLSKKIPLVLIEADRTEFYTHSEYGTPVAMDHYLSLTVFESAQKNEFEDYKPKVNIFVKNLVNKLMMIDDYRISKLIPEELSHNEAQIGSLKVTGVVIGIKVRTDWED